MAASASDVRNSGNSVNCTACTWSMLEFCAMCNNRDELFSFLVRHHVVLGYCGVNAAESFVGSILVVPVFVVTGVTCGVILVVGVVRGVVTFLDSFWVLGLVMFIFLWKLFVS